MNVRVRRSGGDPATAPVGGEAPIVGPDTLPELPSASRRTLTPVQAALSLGTPGGRTDARAVLTDYLGTLLSTGSEAWSRHPVGTMRALQKALLDGARGSDDITRADCLAALGVVESNLRWRLRLQQMADAIEAATAAAADAGAAGQRGEP